MLGSVLTDEDKCVKRREMASARAGSHCMILEGAIHIVTYVVCAPCGLNILVGEIGNK